MKKEEFYEVKWTFSCKMEELISRAARNPKILAFIDEIRIQSNAQHCFNKKKIYNACFDPLHVGSMGSRAQRVIP